MKKIIYIIFIIILLLPGIQKQSKIFPVGKLNGAFYPSDNIAFSIDHWFSNDYQKQKESYLKDHIGFRSHFIRTQNQLLYSLYNKANTPGSVIGKEDYLFLDTYIYNHTGENFIGEKKIFGITKKLKYLQDYFAQKNITLITAFLPSKASFFPEFIPDRFENFNKSNYSEFIKAYDKLDLNYIDLISYFNQVKSQTDYPLFPKNGLHWTSYGMTLAMDTLIKTIEEKREIDIQDLKWEKPILSSKEVRSPDVDAENLLNLLWDLEKQEMPYPKFIFNKNSEKIKPKTLIISDSYYWQAYQAYIPHNLFDWGGFWYYFNTLREKENEIEKIYASDSISVRDKLLSQDVIVLFASQATLHIFPYEFDSKAYHFFMPRDSISLSNYFRSLILNTKSWKDTTIEKAKKGNITFEEQLRIETNWLSKKYLKENRSKEEQINRLINQIKADETWYNSIKEKAPKHNKSVDEMLRIDAEWLYKKSITK